MKEQESGAEQSSRFSFDVVLNATNMLQIDALHIKFSDMIYKSRQIILAYYQSIDASIIFGVSNFGYSL